MTTSIRLSDASIAFRTSDGEKPGQARILKATEEKVGFSLFKRAYFDNQADNLS
jgi:hypothetical protein